MPWKPISVGKSSFYLDQSTLSDVFKSLRLEASERDREYLPLVNWVINVAHDANLCVGWPHVYELAAWDGPEPQALAQWLDELPLVWVNQTERVIQSELRCGLRREAGLSDVPAEPFAPSYLATYETLELDALCGALGHTSLPEIVKMARAYSPTRWRAQSWKYAQLLHEDRKQSTLHPNFARQILNAREGERLRSHLQRMLDVKSDQPNLVALDHARVVNAMLKRVAERPEEFRCYHTTRLLGFEFAEHAAVVKPDSKKFKDMGSSALDIEHAAAAASYCNVFTCDKLTSNWLGDIRTKLYGLPRQVARKEYLSSTDFVNALMAMGP